MDKNHKAHIHIRLTCERLGSLSPAQFGNRLCMQRQRRWEKRAGVLAFKVIISHATSGVRFFQPFPARALQKHAAAEPTQAGSMEGSLVQLAKKKTLDYKTHLFEHWNSRQRRD